MGNTLCASRHKKHRPSPQNGKRAGAFLAAEKGIWEPAPGTLARTPLGGQVARWHVE